MPLVLGVLPVPTDAGLTRSPFASVGCHVTRHPTNTVPVESWPVDQVTGLLNLLSQTMNGRPYYGLSATDALGDVDASTASSRPPGAVHSIREIVAHVASELRYSASLL